MRLYPMALRIEGRRCVVIGGGEVAARKVASLLECGGAVTVIGPEVCPEISDFAARGAIALQQRRYREGDLADAVVVIAATNRREVNEAVAGEARRAGTPVNVVDVPDLCDFYVPAAVKRGDLTVTVSTGGACPAFAKRLRQDLEKRFGPEYGPYMELLEWLRGQLKARVADREMRHRAELEFLDGPALSLLADGNADEARGLAEACVAKFEK